MIHKIKPDTKTETQYQINVQDWIKKDTYYYHKIQLRQNNVKANHFSYVFIDYVLKGAFKFSVRFETEQKLLALGIAGVENKSLATLNDNYVVLFNIGNFSAFGHFIKEFKKSSAGDIISVIGNIQTGSIEFQVNNAIICTYSYEQLTRENIQFVPVIRLDKDSEASVIELFPQISVLGVFLSESFYVWDYDIIYEVHRLIKIGERNEEGNTNQ